MKRIRVITTKKGIEVGNVTVNEKYSKTGIESGEGIKIKAKKVVEFKISKAFKNQFNKKTK